MNNTQRAIAITVTSLLSALLVGGTVATAAASFLGEGNVGFDSISVGRQGVGGVTFFNGSIINTTTGNGGVDNPVTFADNVRIDGRVFRGATQGPSDGMDFIIDDDAQVTGDLLVAGSINAGSIAGLSAMISSMVSASSSAQFNELGTRLTTVEAKNATQDNRLSALEGNVEENRAAVIAATDMLRCVTALAQYTTYVWSDDVIYCWNEYVAGTPILPPLRADDSGIEVELDAPQ